MALDSTKRDPEVGGIAADRLQSLIERRGLGSDIKDIYAEIEEAETLLDFYPCALGM